MDENPLENQETPPKSVNRSSAQRQNTPLLLPKEGRLSPCIVRVFTFLVLLALGIYAIFFLYHALVLIRFPFTLDYGEPYLVNQAKIYAEGNFPYLPVDSPPYTVSNYPPFYPAIIAVFVNLFGPAFSYGRAISLVSCLTISFLLGAMVFCASGKRTPAVIAALALLSFYHVYEWGAYCRVDPLALMIALREMYPATKGKAT